VKPVIERLAREVEVLKRDRQYTGPQTAPIDDPSDPVHPRAEDSFAVCARDAADIVRPPGHPLSQAQPDRLEAWALTTLDGDRQGVWFERGSAEPIPGEEVQHRLVELRGGERIVPEGSIVLTGEQLSAIKGESERVVTADFYTISAELAEKVRSAIRRAITHNVGIGLTDDDLRALGIEVDRG